MSILIKGMEMPKGNDSIALFIYPDGEVVLCGMLGPLGRYTAVPVPPHGRLIDADALARAQGFHNYKYDNGLMYVEVGEVVSLIKAAPTIIPAEEEPNGRA